MTGLGKPNLTISTEEAAEEAENALKFKIDDNIEADIEGNAEYLPGVISRLNDDGTYDVEFVGNIVIAYIYIYTNIHDDSPWVFCMLDNICLCWFGAAF